MVAAAVPDTEGANQVLVVPHEGAVVADPGWQRFSALPPFPHEVGAWWWEVQQGQRRIV